MLYNNQRYICKLDAYIGKPVKLEFRREGKPDLVFHGILSARGETYYVDNALFFSCDISEIYGNIIIVE